MPILMDLVRRSKAEPGKVTVASYGVGTPSHVALGQGARWSIG
jgi:tripartite-type tricarboxylate transporter receptor subunit TctC